MSIVNFSIPKKLQSRVEKTIKERGFASKAEFFRMATMHFIDQDTLPISEEERLSHLTKILKKEIIKKYKDKKIPSVEKQLADL
jgi:metal-responsive CopG/Arc/MetJ family transcriptional regulator